ncbi:tyrosine-protein kinase domain-containing protein [Calothrix sp. PCC 7507]|uniref:GumC family protein n=1 Tax=Calothrix sp. PCC 7507 TaxID=99598 RepID=UPI00029EEE0F|nr:tyrosine-protein kinase domain-containing protein [Calothrix sp. PCC 7507]AFY32495.1 lipopolysaccharide biosynthesis protein [Calothrix sp. PCC 7507]
MKVSTIIKNHWLPLLGLNGTILGCSVVIAGLSPRTWTANSQFILPDTTTNLDANLGTLGQIKDQGIAFTNELSPLQVQTSIITSNDVLRPLWSTDPEKDKYPVLESYKKLFKVKAVDQSTTIQVEVQGSLAELAKQRSERLIKSYQRRVNELRQGTSAARQQFSQVQLEDAERKLRVAKNKLAQFKKSTGLVSSEDQTKNLVEAIKSTRMEKTQTSAQAQAAKIRSDVLSKRIGMTSPQAISSLRLSQNKEYQALRQKLSEIDTAIAVAQGDFTGNHPTVKSLQDKRDQLVTALYQRRVELVPNATGVDTSFGGNSFKDTTMDLIAELIQADAESKALQQQALQLQNEVDNLQSQLSKFSTKQAELSDLQRRYDIAEGVYKGIVAQLEQSKITAFNAYPNVQVLDQPRVNPKPISPKLSLIALGAILSSILGSAALISFLESRNPLLKPKDLRGIELPILARIPTCKSSTLGLSLESGTDIWFQRLASTISLMPLANRRLMVSSSTPGEGKTTVTLGLAAALSFLGFRVLIVDGDFHQAKLSHYFGYVLPKETVVLPTPVQINYRWDLLPAMQISNGRAVEFVARGGFERHLDAIQKAGKYDYVIVDSAPVGCTSEAALMASAIANVLLVIQLGVSDRHMVQESMEQLIRHHARIIGLVMNGDEKRAEGYVYKHDGKQVNS